MTSEESPLTSKTELNAAMTALVHRAHGNGVEQPDWDVIVTEVEKPNHRRNRLRRRPDP